VLLRSRALIQLFQLLTKRNSTEKGTLMRPKWLMGNVVASQLPVCEFTLCSLNIDQTSKQIEMFLTCLREGGIVLFKTS